MPLPKPLAHLRRATGAEVVGFLAPMVCVLEGRVHYRFDSLRNKVTDATNNEVIPSRGIFRSRVFTLPEGKSLAISGGKMGLLFNGKPVEDVWPTPMTRRLVWGERWFRVKPEDDTLLFEVEGERPDLEMTIVGFYLTPSNEFSGEWSFGD